MKTRLLSASVGFSLTLITSIACAANSLPFSVVVHNTTFDPFSISQNTGSDLYPLIAPGSATTIYQGSLANLGPILAQPVTFADLNDQSFAPPRVEIGDIGKCTAPQFSQSDLCIYSTFLQGDKAYSMLPPSLLVEQAKSPAYSLASCKLYVANTYECDLTPIINAQPKYATFSLWIETGS